MKFSKRIISIALIITFIFGIIPYSTAAENSYQKGDINNNNEIDTMDYILLKRAYFGTYSFNDNQREYGDINDNNEIDSMDYVLLKRIYFGTYVYNEPIDYKALAITGLTVNELGHVTWDQNEDIEGYHLRVYEGNVEVASVFQFDNYTELNNGERLVIYAYKGNTNGPESEISFQNNDIKDSDILSLMYAARKSATTDSNGVTTYKIKIATGKTVRICTQKCSFNDDGTLLLKKGGSIYSLDSLGKMVCFNIFGDGNFISIEGGYSFSDKTAVNSTDEIYYLTKFSSSKIQTKFSGQIPNFIRVTNPDGDTVIDDFKISSIDGTTGLKRIEFSRGFFPNFMEGDPYIEDIETMWDPDNNIFTFYLVLIPDSPMKSNGLPDSEVHGTSNYKVGSLKDEKGTVVDKKNAILKDGYTLEISVGSYTMDVPLVNCDKHIGADNMNDLVPDVYPEAIGEINAIAIPYGWNDTKSKMTDEALDSFRKILGNVIDKNGKVTKYTIGGNDYSLSEYYNISSYGKLNINTFLTDWYTLDKNYKDSRLSNWREDEIAKLSEWIDEKYPNLDKSKFDKDGNGVYDSIILFNVADFFEYSGNYLQLSYDGAYHQFYNYAVDSYEQGDKLSINSFIQISKGLLYNTVNGNDIPTANVLIHEFGHNLGLVDYYDVTYSGISPLGKYDMQDSNVGDWNAYSKFATGWAEPKIIDNNDFKGGNSTTIDIRSFAETGDFIVIPAAGSDYTGTPFDEYIIVELFTYEALNKYDHMNQFASLKDTVGVRIYHVNATMEEHIVDTNGGSSKIGTIHYTNSYDFWADFRGYYLIELIQATGKNTFTNLNSLDTIIDSDDFFKAGDTFTVENYSEFFYNGLMDDGKQFGYSIAIDSIDVIDGEYIASITISR